MVIHRKVGQHLVLMTPDGKVSVTIHEVTDLDGVRLLVKAPRKVRVLREPR
jgi:sRNA-binding carbon storage regulator CsrA